MHTHREQLENGGPSGWDGFSNFAGEVIDDHWYILLSKNRDSECLSESNWDCAIRELGGLENDSIDIVRHGHWACGWIEYLIIDSRDPKTLAIATEIDCALADYPVLDDSDFSEREQEQADSFWRQCFNDAERIQYMRDFRYQFEFPDFACMLACARGEYFAGYASELLY